MRLHPEVPTTENSADKSEIPAKPVREPMSPLRRRVLWALSIAALLLLLVLTPPLVNANRYRTQIAHSMSESLGRPVHLDNVSLHLLPGPGFTLRNLVVSEDPAFGAEPTIRANTVEATLRLPSLWHRPVEFSTIRFIEPSVNLVRNSEGRWNLADVLLHASRVNTAPTDQRKAGPSPRFPYIEATGGRVNVKYGNEKLPFSLTDTDFALWLPSPQQWRVRLLGHPARTDTDVTETGTLRVEGELKRASSVAEIPVNFRASWHDAPLGEASRLVTGDDMGWRGLLNLDATLAGPLGNGTLTTVLTIGGLRRAEFFPTRPLDLQLTCASGFEVQSVSLRGLECILPDEAPQPLAVKAQHVDLQRLQSTEATVSATALPVRYALLWAALFSSRVPTDLRPGGTVDLNLTRGGTAPPVSPAVPKKSRRGRQKTPSKLVLAPTLWAGEVRLSLPAVNDTSAGEASLAADRNTLLWQLDAPLAGSAMPTLRLQPAQLRLGEGAALVLTGNVSAAGYSLSITGNAPPAAVLVPARYLPQLGDGLDAVLTFPPTSLNPGRVDFTCTRTWSAPQVCIGPKPPAPGGRALPLATPGGSQGDRSPSLLTPRNLSPLEQAPFSTPRPATTPRALPAQPKP